MYAILSVDDSNAIRQATLTRTGFTVTQTNYGVSALSVAKQAKLYFVMADINQVLS